MGSKTGGNTEPMPFVRKWGAAATDTNGAAENGSVDPLASEVAGPALPPPDEELFPRKKDKERSRSRSKDRKRDRKRSRSKDRKKRSRSRERKNKKSRSRSPRERKRSRDRRRSRSRDRRDRSRSRERRRERDRTPEPATPAGPREPVINPLLRPEVVAELAAQAALQPDDQSQALALLPSAERKRERKSRWSEHKSFIPGMPTILPPDLPDEQRAAYLLQMEVEDATRKLRLGAFDAPVDPSQRSPSPEPVYDANGKRLNTRDVRKRQELEQFRHEKIQQLVKLNPNFKPPTDYRPPNIKLHDKVWIPQDAHPELNFVGLLIGPRGNTLKSLEMETGAKIIIRGKGSIKEGKLANRMGPMPGENEPLHAYVTAGDLATIKKACDRIRQIIAEATCIPDGQNALRQLQLRELALLNGTFRPEDLISGARCSNCGSDEHKTWECPEAPNVTASIICASCGCAGHLTKDCLNPRPGGVQALPDMASIDSEYDALMQELGGGERPNPMPAPEAAASKPQQQPFTLPGMQNKNRPGYMGVQPHYQNAFDPQRLQSQAQAWAAQQAAAQQAAGGYQDSSANFYSSPGAQRGKNQAYTDGSFYGGSTQVQPVPPPSQAKFQPPPPPPPPVPPVSSGSSDTFFHLLRAPPPPPPQ